MRTTSTKKRAVLGLLAAALAISVLSACEYTSDKDYASVKATTGLYDGEDAWVEVDVRNNTGGPIGVTIDVEDGSGRPNATFTMPSSSSWTSRTFDDPEIQVWNPNGVDIWVRIYDPPTNQTLEWHNFDDVSFPEA
jgi:hypothetical protein